MSDDIKKIRKAFVIYVPSKGYMKNRRGAFVQEFEQARLFGREEAAIDASKKSKALAKEDTFIIDVDMELDPRKIFKKILVGK